MKLTVLTSIDDIDATQWNTVAGSHNPFLRHEFLAALERHGCVGPEQGWIPRHLAAFDNQGQLQGAVPLYIKDNSYGEFVFDWAWADAWARHGLEYYPKTVSAIPYTPATGPRLLLRDTPDKEQVALQLVELARQWSQSEQMSSLHWLFTDRHDTALLEQQGYLLRLGCQFHWRNDGYRDFDHFLEHLNARKRKKILRERRFVSDAKISIAVVDGTQASEEQLLTMHEFYRTTFEKKWGHPTLTLAFFDEIARTMGEQLIFFIASKDEDVVAGSICFRSDDTLYGRHWGCRQDFHSLHFETCYYQGIDYCIGEGLQYFEPGAQGEHKISRGFLPTQTWSAHWIAHKGFRDVIQRHLVEETAAMREYMKELASRSPFKQVTGT